jgi:hypothetical protein
MPKTKSTLQKSASKYFSAFLRGHYPEQVHRVISQLQAETGLLLPWPIQFFRLSYNQLESSWQGIFLPPSPVEVADQLEFFRRDSIESATSRAEMTDDGSAKVRPCLISIPLSIDRAILSLMVPNGLYLSNSR